MRILEFVEQCLLELQNRVDTGDTAQRYISWFIKSKFPNLKIGRPQYAKKSSQSADIVLKINDIPYTFEVKNRTTRHILIQLFSETIWRGEPGKKMPRFLKMMGYTPDFTKVMDLFRKRDKTVGFSGDPGVDSASGKMPLLGAPTPQVLDALRKEFIQQLQDGNVNYFAMVTTQNDAIQIFWTGLGQNILRADPLPAFLYARLDTSGAADYPKSIRACVKARLE